MKLGFIGTGALASAIVTGLKSAPDSSASVLLSPRNEEIAADLASRYRMCALQATIRRSSTIAIQSCSLFGRRLRMTCFSNCSFAATITS